MKTKKAQRQVNAHAAALGHMRALKLTPEERKASALHAAQTRWERERAEKAARENDTTISSDDHSNNTD